MLHISKYLHKAVESLWIFFIIIFCYSRSFKDSSKKLSWKRDYSLEAFKAMSNHKNVSSTGNS